MKKENIIRVLMVAPHEPPEVTYLENKLEVLQTAVSIGADYRGLIEIVGLSEDTCIVCHEEGKLIGLPPNRRLGRDILCGVFYIAGQNKDGDLTSLTEAQIATYTNRFAEPEDIPEHEVGHTLIIDFEII